MDTAQLIAWFSDAIYPVMGITGLYGAFCTILLVRRIKQKRFTSEADGQAFLDSVRDCLDNQKFEQAAELCDSPPYWAKAVPQLILIALANRNRSVSKLRTLMAEHFERDVLAEFDYRLSWINTVIKTAPMLGLLGTVLGMIAAFGKIASMQNQGTDPGALAGDISFALFTTALGLIVAVPLMLGISYMQVRIGRLQDQVQQFVTVFLEDFEAAAAKAGKR